MGFGGFLKGLGKAVSIGSQIAIGTVGVTKATVPEVANTKVDAALDSINQIASAIVVAEVMANSVKGMTGEQKLQAATPLVLQALYASSVMQGRSIENQELAMQGAADIASGMAKFMSAIKENK